MSHSLTLPSPLSLTVYQSLPTFPNPLSLTVYLSFPTFPSFLTITLIPNVSNLSIHRSLPQNFQTLLSITHTPQRLKPVCPSVSLTNVSMSPHSRLAYRSVCIMSHTYANVHFPTTSVPLVHVYILLDFDVSSGANTPLPPPPLRNAPHDLVMRKVRRKSAENTYERSLYYSH